jgi:Dyp-type peroxidase family
MTANFEQLEPVLDGDEIQGNVLGGFNKDHQAVLPLHFDGDAAAVRAARAWLADLLPRLTWLPEVVAYKRRRRQSLAAGGVADEEPVVWRNVALSAPGLGKLTPQIDAFEGVFKAGLAAASFRLGDPGTPGQPGHPSTWVVGRPGAVPDALVIIAGDDAGEVDAEVSAFLDRAAPFGVSCPFHDVGHDLSHYGGPGAPFPKGREHFGFKDGVSQPGIRGRMSQAAGDFLTDRIVADVPHPSPSQPQLSSPGQVLVCAGEFVLGYGRQVAAFPRRAGAPWPLAPEPRAVAPAWARNGSFLVYRRLRQDVPAFNRFLAAEAGRLCGLPGLAGLTAETLGAMLIGRWRSGAPLLRTPAGDNQALGANGRATNAFGFATGEDPGDGFPPGQADVGGLVCPKAAHIRKVNPRDLPTDQGPPPNTLAHRILRRGIPFGPPLPFGATEDPDGQERGLLFLGYQASISAQFEFLAATWMNDASKPDPFPRPDGVGIDLVVGQNNVTAGGERFCLVGPAQQRVTTAGQAVSSWVIPTGGGYFFAPSRSALRDVLIGG